MQYNWIIYQTIQQDNLLYNTIKKSGCAMQLNDCKIQPNSYVMQLIWKKLKYNALH